METLLIVFMVFVMVICLFSVAVVARDIIKDHQQSKAQAEKEATDNGESAAKSGTTNVYVTVPNAQVSSEYSQAALSPAPKAQAQAQIQAQAEVAEAAPVEKVAEVTSAAPIAEVVPIANTVQAEEVAADDEDEEGEYQELETMVVDPNAVTFSPNNHRTHKEKYLALSALQREMYDDIAQYAMSQTGTKVIKNDRYEEYKQGNNRLVRMKLRRGLVECEFVLLNPDFKNYVNENKVAAKQAPIKLKIVDANTVKAAKDMIDIAVKIIAEEREYKKQLAREKRAAARRQAAI